MKFFCVCFGMMIGMLGIWVEVGTAQDPITITATEMPDANLRAAVLARLKALNIVASTATTFTDDDMANSGFTVFSGYKKEISDMTGLKYATSLTQLNLNNNSISTIRTDLPTSLQKLHLEENSISTIPDLSSLNNLIWLYLTDNSISAIPTTLPTSLTELRLGNNSISTIPDLSSLTSLSILYLYSNNISAIPTTLPTSLTQLDLSGNSISDISAVSRLTNLNTLWLGNNKISDISDLSGLTSLLHLGLGRNNISDFSAVESLKTKLVTLYLTYSEISDLSVVSELTNLTTLYLTGSKIRTTDALLPLTKLITLDIAGHQITDVGEFQKLAVLRHTDSGKLQFLYLEPYPAFEVDLSILDDPDALRVYLYVPPPPEEIPPPVEADPEAPPKRKIIIYQCPVGWQRSDTFARKTQRVIIYEVNLDMDLQNRVSIYKPTSVAIYVHPDEALETLDGWKLQVAIPYNYHRDYLLTAENSVVVDSEIEGVEGGFAFIENPEEAPFPMTGMGFWGSLVPGFDYRLYDDRGQRVDFGIACYKRGDIFQVLKNMEDPRVFRKVDLETLDWDVPYIRSEWTVPVPVNVPGAPSLQGANLVGKWADLKKQ